MSSKKSYFNTLEMTCNCGCGKIVQIPHFLAMMNSLRFYMGEPINITSWTRCKKHNINVGGNIKSSHLFGYAADVFIPSLSYRYRIIFFAGIVGFTAIGIGKDFTHLEYDKTKIHPRIWTYPTTSL